MNDGEVSLKVFPGKINYVNTYWDSDNYLRTQENGK